jgi:GNAT superfamily N-acetyltransferase
MSLEPALAPLEPPSEIDLRRGVAGDVAGVTSCVCEAYVPYIERIGKQPGPMLEDYAEVFKRAHVHVAVIADRVVGAIVLTTTEDGFHVDNVAVRPAVKGLGVGRRLLEFAEGEARRQGHASICLATHELMTENRALYERIGYSEFDHRQVGGYPRVYFRKFLSDRGTEHAAS